MSKRYKDLVQYYHVTHKIPLEESDLLATLVIQHEEQREARASATPSLTSEGDQILGYLYDFKKILEDSYLSHPDSVMRGLGKIRIETVDIMIEARKSELLRK